MIRLYWRSLAILGSATLLVAAALGSERVNVYRCGNEDGGISLQDHPCPPGSEQTLRQLRRPIDAQPGASRPIARVPEIAHEPEPSTIESVKSPPPPLWTCVDFDGQERESTDGIGRGRYVLLWVVGRDPYAPRQLFGRVGERLPQPSVRPPTGPRVAMGQDTGSAPLVYVEERCYRLSSEQSCARYAAQRDQIERVIFNSQSSDRAVLKPKSTALRLLLQDHCGY